MVQIKMINRSGNELPAYETAGAAGMDVRANLPGPESLKPMERKLIPTGLFVEIPAGYEIQVIHNNDRIAQMVLAKVETALLLQATVLNESERGAGGFGHTGK